MRTSINPHCPYCNVRHEEIKQWRCKELAEADEAEAARLRTPDTEETGR